MLDLDENFWTHRYRQGATGWDVGSVSPPINQYLCQIENKNLRILVAGAGNAYEVATAWDLGFKNVCLLDFSPVPIQNFLMKHPDFPHGQVFQEDFFHHQKSYDLILEQTFFCALNPELREAYAEKMHELLVPGGKLVGVLFTRNFPFPGPPFGGDEKEYRKLFQKKFLIKAFEPCTNSIPQRTGSELWINLQKSNG
ncbi:methyltransferase domain-containing protein [Algoriphagus confluentis]|uniref:Methyltransferase domain-containing protein n=1 Tax=Algoriphagus confluentis TaxID=1697556 RepID=A0ABQ6PN54_9BACT|nr:methyltransferase domain-containing protein [Algoriphagus confluentis]